MLNEFEKIDLDKNRFEEIKYNLNSVNTKDCKLFPWIIQEPKSFIIAEVISKT